MSVDDSEAVYVIDDDRAVRDSIAWLLESEGLLVTALGSAQAFMSTCAARGAEMAGCLVVDIRLPGMSGLEMQDRLVRRGVELPVIIITGHGDVPAAVRAMKAGALDFIEKPFSDQLLLDRVREALSRDRLRRTRRRTRDEIEARFQRLTPRERQVMDMVVQGRLNKQIAHDLGLSPKTVEYYRGIMMTKMEAASVAELVHLVLAMAQP